MSKWFVSIHVVRSAPTMAGLLILVWIGATAALRPDALWSELPAALTGLAWIAGMRLARKEVKDAIIEEATRSSGLALADPAADGGCEPGEPPCEDGSEPRCWGGHRYCREVGRSFGPPDPLGPKDPYSDGREV